MLTEPDFVEKKIIIVMPQRGDKNSFKNDNIIITDINEKIKFQLTCYKLFAVFIVGGFSMTTGIIEKSKKFGFSVVLFTTTFKVYSAINYSMEGNTLLRKKQYETQKSNEIAKAIIINKIRNQRDILKKLRDTTIADGIINLDIQIDKLIRTKPDNYEIMGIEGISAKVYFNRLFKNLEWNGRQPRVKRDKINLLMDIGYTVLFNYIEAILNIYGFDVYKGNLHKEFYKRKSLVCDIIEPFRPIVDYKIRKCMNLKQLDNYKYTIDNGQYHIDWKDGTHFMLLILEAINEYKVQIFRYIQQYYRWVMKDKEIKDFPKVVLLNDYDKL